MFRSLKGLFSTDLAIDLGTASTLIYARGRGVIANEPSVVAVQQGTDGSGRRRVVAVGRQAKQMQGRTPINVTTQRPLRDGVIADYELAEEMLRQFLHGLSSRRSFVKPRIVISVPHGITSVERRAVRESAEAAGGREVFLIEEPMAAAIGTGLPVLQPSGSMIVDIGGGTTEVAVISLGGVVFSRSIRCGGDHMDDSIVNYVKRTFNVAIGESTAERIKLAIGAAIPSGQNPAVEVRGRDMVSGLPKAFQITEADVREALNEPLKHIIEAVQAGLEHTPPELASDIVDRGITLTGGGALLRGIESFINQRTELPVVVAEDPISAVVVGTGRVLDNEEVLRNIAVH
ncbi:MAG: rod shape-determining protein [bacterium]|nr:rod shape-determining protein [bacterium]